MDRQTEIALLKNDLYLMQLEAAEEHDAALGYVAEEDR